MVDTVLELLVAPALVGAATLAARRWGQEIGGVVSAFPAIVGPVLLIAALEHGATFAARAANGTLLGLVALATFALAYGWAAARLGWPASLAAAWAAAGLAGLLVGAVAAGPPAGLAAAAISLAAAHRLLRRAAGRAHAPRAGTPVVSRWDLPLRMALTALLVLTLTAAASRFGPVVGGILAALPALASILAVFTHARCGAVAVVDLLRGMLGGMAGFVAFCALVAGAKCCASRPFPVNRTLARGTPRWSTSLSTAVGAIAPTAAAPRSIQLTRTRRARVPLQCNGSPMLA